MAQVKFVNEAKYRGTCYPAHTPFEVEDGDVEVLVQKGAIVIEAPKAAKSCKGSGKSVDEMKVDELKAYAQEHNIDISGVDKKADILAAIKAAEISKE